MNFFDASEKRILQDSKKIVVAFSGGADSTLSLLATLANTKDKSKITYASSQVHYKVKPGRMIFFPSYMPHQYIVDMGYEPFRFIHWNCQAIPKGVLDVVQKK